MRTDLQTEVGARLRQMREAKGLSQEALAERAGLHRNYVGSVERGERDVGLNSLAAMATALGSSLADFFGDFRKSARPKRSAT